MFCNIKDTSIHLKTQLRMLLIPLLSLLSAQNAFAFEVDGVLDWNKRVSLSTSVSGVVSQVFVQLGDKVDSGAKLLELDNAVFSANVEKTSAAVVAQDRLYLEAERELDRNQELYDRTVLSDHDLEMAKVAFDNAALALASAKADLALAEQQLKYSVIRAPFNAYVIGKSVEPGQTIVTTQTAPMLLEVVDADTMLAKVKLSFSRVKGLKKGKPATVAFGKNRVKAAIQSIGIEPVNKNKDQYLVSVAFNTDGRRFYAGQKVKVNIP